jgi:8-oxo-dGTP diphosphatase
MEEIMEDLIKYRYTDGKEYPVILVCADAVVFSKTSDGEPVVCMITRTDNGKYALPGGFTDYEETLRQTAFRELKEETGLDLTGVKPVGEHLFDGPKRSGTGNRRITLATIFEIPRMVELNGGDDAAQAFWMRIKDVLSMSSDKIQDDHAEIVARTWLIVCDQRL